jgi:hypothetical protein
MARDTGETVTPLQKWKAEIEIGRDAITRMLARGENLAAVETWRETYAPSGPPVFSAQRAADYKPILDRWNWIENVFGMAEGNTAGTLPRGHDLDVVSLPAAPPVGLGIVPIIAGAIILGGAILATVTVYQLAMEAERTDRATAKNFDAWIARQPAAMQSAYKDLIASDPILKSNSWLDSLSNVGSAIGWIALAALAFFVFTQLRATLPRPAAPTPNPCKGRRGGSAYTSRQLKHVREWYATPKTKKKKEVKRYYYQPEMRTHASDASW